MYVPGLVFPSYGMEGECVFARRSMHNQKRARPGRRKPIGIQYVRKIEGNEARLGNRVWLSPTVSVWSKMRIHGRYFFK